MRGDDEKKEPPPPAGGQGSGPNENGEVPESEFSPDTRQKKQKFNSGSPDFDDPDRPRWDAGTVVEAKFDYTREDGTYSFTVNKGRRADGRKTFTRGRRCQGGNDWQEAQRANELYRWPGLEQFRIGSGDEPDLLYRLPDLIAAMAERPDEPVFICEGEKDVETLWGIGLIATTNANGALHWKPEHTAKFADRDVVVLTDNDEKGHARGGKLFAALDGTANTVRVIDLPGLPVNGDVTDWLSAGKTKDDLLRVVTETTPGQLSAAAQQALDEAEFQRLAGLGRVAYARERKTAAARLGINLPTLDDEVALRRSAEPDEAGAGTALNFEDIAPATESVDGEQLIAEVKAVLKRHVVFHGDEHALAVGLWAVHAHLIDVAEHTPRLHISAPTKQCGKTVLLNTVAALVPRPLRVEHVTPAALFRVTEEHQPTLLIDEVDTFLKDNEDMRGLLNAGHQPDTRVVRCVGENQEVRGFSVFAATALAGIGEIPATIEDRSITVPLRRRIPSDDPIERLRRNRDHLAVVAGRIARWAEDNRNRLASDPAMPEELGDRAQDNWRLLVAIADCMGPTIGAEARKAALALEMEKDHDDNERSLMALADVHAVFAVAEGKAALSSSYLVERLVEMEERPWAQWRRGAPLTQNSLARLLRPFSIKPKQVKSFNGRGYERAPVEEAFQRYCAKPAEEIEVDDPM